MLVLKFTLLILYRFRILEELVMIKVYQSVYIQKYSLINKNLKHTQNIKVEQQMSIF